MKVLKFGGSSVAKPERIKHIINILKGYQQRGEKFTVICSAFGGVTDSLIEMATKASKADKSYLELFEAFSQRHIQAAKELLKSDAEKAVIKEPAISWKSASLAHPLSGSISLALLYDSIAIATADSSPASAIAW